MKYRPSEANKLKKTWIKHAKEWEGIIVFFFFFLMLLPATVDFLFIRHYMLLVNIRFSEFVANCKNFLSTFITRWRWPFNQNRHFFVLLNYLPSLITSSHTQIYMTTHEAWPSPPKPLNKCFVIVDVCVSLERALSSCLSISSHAFDSRPPATFVFEIEYSFLREILLSFAWIKSMVGRNRTHALRVNRRLLTPKTTMSWLIHTKSVNHLCNTLSHNCNPPPSPTPPSSLRNLCTTPMVICVIV